MVLNLLPSEMIWNKIWVIDFSSEFIYYLSIKVNYFIKIISFYIFFKSYNSPIKFELDLIKLIFNLI